MRLRTTIILLIATVPTVAAARWRAGQAGPPHASSAVLAQLPDGEFKRQFIIDCTNCHQFTEQHAYNNGAPRTRDEWATIVGRMLQFSGANTGFPIMSAGRDARTTADWLVQHLTSPPTADASRARAPHVRVERPGVVEYLLPQPNDLAHDVAVDSSGRVLVTGMFTHVMYVLDTATMAFTPEAIPVPQANPRAVEIAANGDWWVLLGGPNRLARRRGADGGWDVYGIGMYGHSVALDRQGRAWFNGHFTRDPARIGFVDSSGSVRTIDAPRHPSMAAVPGGPIPYELRVAPDGKVWMSELQGHRMLSFDPSSNAWRAYDLPTTISAPRRFDVAPDGTVWIPSYGANSLARLTPATGAVIEIPLPTADAVPYVARVHRGQVWVGTNASDEVYRYDIAGQRWTTYPLPSRGAVIRHLVVDPRNDDVWLAYGGSPGIPARIARLRP